MTHPTVRRCATAALPLNRSLLRRVYVFAHPALEEERSHIVGQKCASLRVHHVEPVMVDQHCLLFQPIAPALLADLLNHACSDLAGEWSAFEAAARLSAARASHVRHTLWTRGDTVDLYDAALAMPLWRVDGGGELHET